MGTPCSQVEKNSHRHLYVKVPAEFFDHCQNFYETFEVPAGCKCPHCFHLENNTFFAPPNTDIFLMFAMTAVLLRSLQMFIFLDSHYIREIILYLQ